MTALLSGLPPAVFAAQGRQAPPARPAVEAPPAPPAFEDQNAEMTRERFREVLGQYPPSVGQVLRLDPSLLTRADYLAPYPALAAFVAQHPAIAHNPTYFLGVVRFSGSFESDTPRAEGIRAIRDVFEGLFFLIGICWGIGMIGWLLRAAIEYRVWARANKIQTETHSKIFDRLTSHDDVLAYVQSPVGQRFLNMAPMRSDFGTRAAGSPANRILWSAQLGVVLTLGGAGLFLSRNNVVYEAAQAIYVVATVTIALGIGFVLSSLAAYLLSRQLGLLNADPSSSHA